MFCSICKTQVQDGDYFCKNCGAPLQAENGIVHNLPAAQGNNLPAPGNGPRHQGQGQWHKGQGQGRGGQGGQRKFARSPYRDQIAQIRLQLKELRMQLSETNNSIRGTRSNYFEFDSFVQRGLVNNVGRMIEGAQLFGPYQQRKQLQDQILQLERTLLPLERAQEQWRLENQQNGPMPSAGVVDANGTF